MEDQARQTGSESGDPNARGPRVQFVNFGSDRMAEAFQAARRQPNWAARAAVLTFLIVIGVPIILLLLAATLAAAVVFSILMSVNWILSGFSGRKPKPPGGGRRNVRVINRK